MPESLKDGRYALLGLLGEGAQGQTFDGVDLREGRPVAIKRFDVRTARTWKDAELAERETRVLQTISHPRLPRYVDHFEHDGALYLVMDKIDGESLASLRKTGAVFSRDEAVRLLRDASEVLEYLHGRTPPVIHRDLKPGNVIRRLDGSFAFVDFGAVRDRLRPEGGSTMVGTFGYMAPEQFQGRALPASDVYSVAATVLSMLTGREPESLPHTGLRVDVRAVLQGRDNEGLVDVLERMLEPDPDRRASRIAPLLERLERSGGRTGDRDASGERPSWRESLREGFEDKAREYEARAQEYEERAARGGAGADGWRRGAEGWRKGADRFRANVEKHHERLARDAERHARREARRAARRARWIVRSRTPGSIPWPLILALWLFFTFGIVAVAIATQIVVPLALQILALLFARRGLTAAAESVRRAGARATENMARSRRWAVGGGSPDDETHDEVRSPGEAAEPPGRARVADDASPKVRVGSAEDEVIAEAEPSNVEATHSKR